MDKRQSFLRGAVVLSVAGALSKVLGAKKYVIRSGQKICDYPG
jgi:hypothetical protein